MYRIVTDSDIRTVSAEKVNAVCAYLRGRGETFTATRV